MNNKFTPIDVKYIASDELILAVKLNADYSNLSRDESKSYTDERDNGNLKSRTLGEWAISEGKRDKIKYVIALNKGSENQVVAAYEVVSFETKDGRTRFQINSSSEATLKKLNLFQRALPNLKYHGAFLYINNKVVLKPVLLLKSNLALRLFTWRKRQALKRS
jgi:hypothetical protein